MSIESRLAKLEKAPLLQMEQNQFRIHTISMHRGQTEEEAQALYLKENNLTKEDIRGTMIIVCDYRD